MRNTAGQWLINPSSSDEALADEHIASEAALLRERHFASKRIDGTGKAGRPGNIRVVNCDRRHNGWSLYR